MVIAATCLVALPLWPAAAQQQGLAPADTPTAEQIAEALEKVKADANLATERKMRTLKWAGKQERRERTDTPAWMEWLADFFRWTGESARVLVWIAAALLAGLLVILTVRLIREHGTSFRGERFVAPTHVRDLDI